MDCQTQQPTYRHSLFVAVACSLLGLTDARWGHKPLAFATPPSKLEENPLKREQQSEVRLFSRGPDTLLSAATLAYTGEAAPFTSLDSDTAAVLDPFDPSFRPRTGGGTASAPWDWATAFNAPALPLDVPRQGQYRIFCDLDGVLVDFEAGVQKICRKSTAELAKTTMWRKIAQSNTAFFAELPWMPDGEKLWKSIRHLNPDILTGVPDLKGSCHDKFQWCRQHLGMEQYRHVDMASRGYLHSSVNGIQKACPQQGSDVTNIITCWSYNKHHESGHDAVLIDDRIALKESWEAKGGIFVHHTDTKSTLRKLRELGVLDSPHHDRTLRP